MIWTFGKRAGARLKAPTFPRKLRYQSQRWQHYQRFSGQQQQSPLFSLVNSPRFYYYCGAAGIGGSLIYAWNLETVPVTGRRRFNVVSEELGKASADHVFQSLLQQYHRAIVPRRDPRHQVVERVLKRLIPATGLPNQEWEVRVIDDPDQANAFVIPGGKVFIFTGILKYCKDEADIAAVLGHELAHTVARHSAETQSRMFVLMALYYVAALFIQGSDFGIGRFIMEYGFNMPGSRRQESEADYIGLMFMAESCYKPDAALSFWKRMQAGQQHSPPQFLSTHPSHENRQARIQEWLPQAEDKYNDNCGSMQANMQRFRAATDNML